MKVGLAIYASREVNSDTINDLSNELEIQFKDLVYGEGVYNLYTGIICVSKDFEPFFKPRKPKYTKNKKENEIDGIKYTTEKSFEFDCKIDFNTYQELDDVGKKSLIASDLLKTTKEVFKKKKIKDFKEEEFIEDLENFFKEQGYLENTLT